MSSSGGHELGNGGNKDRRHWLARAVELWTAVRRLTPFRLVAGLARSAYGELRSPAGKANFIGFMIVLIMILPLLVYTIFNQVLPEFTLETELFDLTILPAKSSTTELIVLGLFMMSYPFLFGLCIAMYEALYGD